MTGERTTERNAAIRARWLELKNFAAVGREYGLQRERTRQIVRRIERDERWKRAEERQP
jgi:DNA-directed RNA polymerase sigma subunit (sigma70/sigma32)